MLAKPLSRFFGRSIKSFRNTSREMSRVVPQSDDELCTKSYNETIEKLNTLQSNIEAIRKIKANERSNNIPEMWRYLSRTGVSPEDLKKLSVIHITGTKGKGSTAAYCESILRSHGYKTGFYSSPHLVHVNERIRLQGKPIDRARFVHYFNRIYSDLYKTQEFEGDMPAYFYFLTIMAFNVFLNENLDVAVIEVGIGGLYDVTNVVNNVVAVGITSLGLDHTNVLGNTIESIAFQKAGIMKPGCKAFTVKQPKSASLVLQDVADSLQCPLCEVPELKDYKTSSGESLHLDTCGSEAYELNISLAVQLAHNWMKRNLIKDDVGTLVRKLPDETVKGLKSCSWPGRFQVLEHRCADFFLDGAHTKESISICAAWFSRNLRNDSSKILVFNVTGNRTLKNLIDSLTEIEFDSIIFMPNVPYEEDHTKCLDSAYSSGELERQLEKCREYIVETRNLLAVKNPEISSKVKLVSTKSAEGTLKYISEISTNQGTRPQVLVTGSLHLVGVMLTVLDPGIGQ